MGVLFTYDPSQHSLSFYGCPFYSFLSFYGCPFYSLFYGCPFYYFSLLFLLYKDPSVHSPIKITHVRVDRS